MQRARLLAPVIVAIVTLALAGCPEAGLPGSGGDPPPDDEPALTAPTTPVLTSVNGDVKRVTLEFETVEGADSYKVYTDVNSGVDSSDSFETVTDSPVTLLGLTGASLQHYRIAAVNAAGESGLSNELNTVILAAANETDFDLEMDYVVIQTPTSTTDPSATIFGRVFEAGLTEAAGENASITAELGYGPAGTDPISDGGWTFIATTYVGQAGPTMNDDEYSAALPALGSGEWAYAFRFSKDDLWYTYADTDGAGSNPTLEFSSASLGSAVIP